MALNARAKGQRGEREGIALLQQWVEQVYAGSQATSPVLSRNLVQSRSGGYDVLGLEWMALEVKRQESSQPDQWWRQTLRQAGEGQVPVLMWRANRQPWRFRLRVPVVTAGPWQTAPLTVDMREEAFQVWFQQELWARMQGT